MQFGGRRRRYFGYPRDLKGVVDTPESAKSYASFLAPTQSRGTALLQEQCSITPAKLVSRRFADDHLHRAIAAEIPALLAPMRNTYRFKDYEKNPMQFHPPRFEHHAERSLYYIWLAKNDRHELSDIVDAHLGSKYNKGLHHNLGENYRNIGNPMQRIPPADYSRMPRRLSVLDEANLTEKSLKPENYNPGNSTRTRFFKDHGQSAALDAICREFSGNERTRVTEKDVRECLLAAKRLLGPYAGINTYFTKPEDVPAFILEQIAEEELLEREKKRHQFETKTTKRPFGYISSQIQYEKQISAAMEYYNKLKLGARHPTPPPEVFDAKEETKRLKTIRMSSKSRIFTRNDTGGQKSIIDIHNQGSMKDLRSTRSRSNVIHWDHKSMTSFAQPSHADLHRGHSVMGFGRKSQDPKHPDHIPKRKFNVENVTEEDYAEMYLHFVGSDEDLSIKKPVQSLTDISKLRKKMHLDATSDDEDEVAIAELLKSDSLSDIRDPIARKIIRGEINLKDGKLSTEDINILKQIMSETYENIPAIPEIKRTLEKFSSHALIDSISSRKLTTEIDGVDRTETGGIPSTPEEEDEFTREELESFERQMGFIDKNVEHLIKHTSSKFEAPTFDLHDHRQSESSLAESSDSDSIPDEMDRLLGSDCELDDLQCLSDAGLLGTPPFGSRSKLFGHGTVVDGQKIYEQRRNTFDDENPDMSIFSKAHWQKKRESLLIKQSMAPQTDSPRTSQEDPKQSMATRDSRFPSTYDPKQSNAARDSKFPSVFHPKQSHAHKEGKPSVLHPKKDVKKSKFKSFSDGKKESHYFR